MEINGQVKCEGGLYSASLGGNVTYELIPDTDSLVQVFVRQDEAVDEGHDAGTVSRYITGLQLIYKQRKAVSLALAHLYNRKR